MSIFSKFNETKIKELVWAMVFVLCTLIIICDPIHNKFIYLSFAIVCELWIAFHLPGSKYLWMSAQNSNYPNYREIRIISAIFLWFFLLIIPRGYDLWIYCIFATYFEKIVGKVFRVPPKKQSHVVEIKEISSKGARKEKIQIMPLLFVPAVLVVILLLGILFNPIEFPDNYSVNIRSMLNNYFPSPLSR